MTRTFKITAIVLLLLMVTSSMAFANNGNGPDYEICPKDEMTSEEVALFEEIIAKFREAMEKLRGVPGMHHERLELKEDKRDSLQEIVPEGFKDRYDNFNREAQHSRQSNGNKNGRIDVE